MKTTIIITVIIVAAIGGLIWWGSSKQVPPVQDTGEKSALTTTSNLYDFGTISMKDGLVTKEFVINNPTDKDIFVPTLVTSCMCTKAYAVLPDGTTKGPFGMPSMGYVPPVNATVEAGGNIVVRAVYDPNAHGPAGVGQIDRFITLTESSGKSLELEIKATVTP